MNFKIFSVESNLGVLTDFLLNLVYHSLYAIMEMKNVIKKSVIEEGKSPPILSSKKNMASEWPNAPTGPNIIAKTGPSPISGTINHPAIVKYPYT